MNCSCHLVIWLAVAAVVSTCGFVSTASAQVTTREPTIKSVQSGPWSAAQTWQGNRLPTTGDVVLIATEHEVAYDVESKHVIRSIHVSGTLKFATHQNTRLEVGLIRVAGGDEVIEDGFDCDPSHTSHANTMSPAQLLVGTADQPIHNANQCLIRLHAIEGSDANSWPAIVCCGGRMEIHGAPLARTWVKLTRTADEGATKIFLRESVTDWNPGDRLVITGTSRQEPSAGVSTEHVTDDPASEVRYIAGWKDNGTGASMTAGAKTTLQLDQPLTRTHRGGDYSAEVANLSRNVIIESADPAQSRGHTMYHHGSRGSISYAEFRHLGKEGVLGRYPIHFHLAGTSMRGSSVVGVSIWDSKNRWITVHGTQYLLVRDCVGFQSVGHGFFCEDGTEVFNIFDRNLAVQALIGKPLPKQVLPYDLNDGAGFWWANSLNAFTRNVAVECDQHGFRFEAVKTKEFDPVLNVLQADGKLQRTDIRTLPFILFEDNEAHCHRRFGLNLGGIRGLTYGQFDKERGSDAYEQSIGGSVEGVGPDPAHPFKILNFKAWDTHWAFHTLSPTVAVDGLDVFDCNYGIWRSVMDLHQYDNLSFKQIHSHAIFFPMGGHGPSIHMEAGKPIFPNYKLKDDRPPVTVITSVDHNESGEVYVKGVAVDDTQVREVLINGRHATSLRNDFAEWEVRLPAGTTKTIEGFAVDSVGNRELRPHHVVVTRGNTAGVRKPGHQH